MCRESSRFITPSSKFWRDGSPEKLKTIEAYRESMAKVQCRYFQKSLLKDKNKPLCPFGKDCFYQHKKEDGTLHEFKDGAEVSLRVSFFSFWERAHS
jgi:E3 ubiquitin-protein ligase makorin